MAELVWRGKGRPRPSPTARLVDEEHHRGPAIEGWRNRLILGEAERVLPGLRELRGKVALAYLDPPFETGGTFDYLAPIGATAAERPVVPAYSDARGLDAWLSWFESLAVALRDVLAPGGSLYVHLDAHVAHYAKVVLDEVLGGSAFQREIVWRIGWVSGFKSRARTWIRNHDTILFYAKGGKPRTFHKEYIAYPPGYVRRDGVPPRGKGVPLDDVWNGSEADRLDSIQIKSFSQEKVGYPTQKNEALLERIVRASSSPGDLVLDACVGSGTTAVVASRLGRRWIACDASPVAVHATRMRLAASRGDVAPFSVQRLAEHDLGPEGSARVRVDVDGLACTLSLASYKRDRMPAGMPRSWKERLVGWSVDWGEVSRGTGALEVGWSGWRDRRGATPLTASHRFRKAGRYDARVRVHDGAGGVATHPVTVRVG